MHLIAPLASGFYDAADGSVDVYVRGTSTRASYYANFEGDGQVTPTAAIPLTSAGRAVVYVNVTVDCVVKDATGAQVASFTAGEGAPAVEVRSSAFTGTNYETGVVGPSQPVSLAAILDAWTASAGSALSGGVQSVVDWKVLSNGSAVNIKDAIGAFGGVFFNVLSYGATGDGASDDTTAIAAALTAAQVTGGIVFFPPGTYRITSALTIGSKVSLWGAGPGASTVLIDHASANLLGYSSATTANWQSIRGLNIHAAQSNSGKLIVVTGAARISVQDCYVGSSNTTGYCLHISTAAAVVSCFSTTFEVGTGATAISSATGMAACYGCRFVTASTYASSVCVVSDGFVAIGCDFDTSGTASGAHRCILFNSLTPAKTNLVAGCSFSNPGGGTTTAIDGAGGINVPAMELGNSFGSSVVQGATSAAATGVNGIKRLLVRHSRDGQEYTINSDANQSLDTSVNAHAIVIRSADTAQTLTLSDPTHAGQTFTVTVFNSSGAPVTAANVAFAGGSSSSVKGRTTPISNIAAGRFSVMRFVAVTNNSSTSYWIGDNPADSVTV